MMAITAALSPLDINLAPPGGRASATSSEAKKSGGGMQPRKQSDYHLIQKLTAKLTGSASKTEPTPPPIKSVPSAPSKTPVKKSSARPSKKILCSTPPVNLRNRKRGVEYDRGRQLGEGGFARCYLVQNKEGKLFAAKTVAKESLQSEKMQAKFFGEIQVQKTMVHPNIVRFVECFEDTRNIYLILELCPNKSLVEMLRRRQRMTEPEARFFMLQTLGALKYMHGKRVIHRDLKLGNIFLDEGMNIKIGDFGLAALLVSDTDRKTTMCGTPNYIAPEVLFGKKLGHSFEVDLWSCGVILYALLVGKPPFQASDINEIYKKIRDSDFDWPIDIQISSQAKALVSALLSKDPNSRPSLDTIADHPFFRHGYFPRSIPQTATTKEPVFKTSNGTIIINSALSATAKAESRRNYMEVARNAGIGIDEAGTPMACVGDDVGRPVSALAIDKSTGTTVRNPIPGPSAASVRVRQRRGDVPPSTAPVSAPSAVASTQATRPPSAREKAKQKQQVDEIEEFVMKVMDPVVIVENRNLPTRPSLPQSHPAASYLSPQQKKNDFLLPEALSPRDGRARMRGTALLRGAAAAPARRPSGLNPARSGTVTDLTAAPGIAQTHRKSRLGQQRGVVEEEEIVDDDGADDVEEVEEEEAPPPPPLQRAPRRRGTASSGSAAVGGIPPTKMVPPKLPDVFPPRRGTARSSAAEARASERAQPPPPPRREPEPVQEEQPAPSSRRAAAAAPTRRTVAVRTASSSTTATTAVTAPPPAPPILATTTPTYQRTSTNLSAISSGSNSSASSGTPIPTFPTLTHSHGTPQLNTTTAAILSTLPSFVTALTSILTATPAAPQNPPGTIRQIDDWRAGEKNTCVFITKWVDYTNKYGIGYTLTDGSCGTMFNDNTGIVCSDGDAEGNGRVWYLSQGFAPTSSSTSSSSRRTRSTTTPAVTETIYNSLETTLAHLQRERQLAATARRYGGVANLNGNKYAKGLSILEKISDGHGDTRLAENKVAMWKRFGTYMKDSLEGGNENDFVPAASAYSTGGGAGGFGSKRDRDLVFITNYARLPQGAFFRFSSGDLQFNFADHTKLILSDGGKTIRFVGNGRKLYVMGCAELWKIVGGGVEARRAGLERWEAEVREGGVKDKVQFVRGFLRSWWREGKIPGVRKLVGQGSGGGEGRGGGGSSNAEEIVVLGEAVSGGRNAADDD